MNSYDSLPSGSVSRVRVLTEASRGHVGGDEYAAGGHAELVEHIVSVLLVLVSVDSQCAPPRAVDRFCYFIDLYLSLYEYLGAKLY